MIPAALAIVVMTIPGGISGSFSGTAHAGETTPIFGKKILVKYTVYSHWIPVMTLEDAVTLDERHYSVAMSARADGLLSIFLKLNTRIMAKGSVSDTILTPEHYDASGWSRRKQRHVVIDYTGGTPQLTTLDPPESDREPVPATLLRSETADILSSMAKNLLQIRKTGKCDGTYDVYDGVRLTHLTFTGAGSEMMKDISGQKQVPALKCTFSGYQVAGFIKGHTARTLREPHGGAIWFETIPDFGPLPVKVLIDHPKVGHLSVSLDSVANQGG